MADQRMAQRRPADHGGSVRAVDTLAASMAAGVTDRTVRRWVKAGKLANVGTARRVRVDLDALLALVADVR
jgi:fatty acid-binding protein DegV